MTLSDLGRWRPGPAATLLGGLGVALAVALVAIGPARLIAQVEGDRGILPVATSSDVEISGITVNTTGKTGWEARLAGWKVAQKQAWAKAGGAPLADGVIESMVSAVVIEREQIGPRRYIATLTIVFDRARAGQYLGAVTTGVRARSAPLLTIPVLYSGGVAQVFEVRGPWQAAWAQFRGGTSRIDYVRPSGAGGESLLVTAGQPARRSRAWWHTVLDQFGAADVIVPEARLERQWPGGPVRGTFTARYGPDRTFLESFTLTANDEAGVPRMLADAVVRIDAAYARALEQGLLKPDPTIRQGSGMDAGLVALIQRAQAAEQAARAAAAAPETAATPGAEPTATAAATSTFTVQFASPDAGAVDAALAAVRGAPGVQGASTTSLAMGGTSVMRVSYAGDLSALAAALRARGWQVSVGSNALSIRR
ncbi:heavy-metal-associated domain-containing protein [Novosphingobium sp.]|uniref:heavy-metal-associated domain-containing protein n=1 Tax=Novosphingobium sp. TaxID=1874826 RepID=UPI0027338C0A|nr:heavy-metal-associated domain-containing protein [Novosphingobium sp.]MDP3907237.1 heavy-metal-associated domain-containing protein [Novosphingobium sp.]